jgi:hypothetical protein
MFRNIASLAQAGKDAVGFIKILSLGLPCLFFKLRNSMLVIICLFFQLISYFSFIIRFVLGCFKLSEGLGYLPPESVNFFSRFGELTLGLLQLLSDCLHLFRLLYPLKVDSNGGKLPFQLVNCLHSLIVSLHQERVLPVFLDDYFLIMQLILLSISIETISLLFNLIVKVSNGGILLLQYILLFFYSGPEHLEIVANLAQLVLLLDELIFMTN